MSFVPVTPSGSDQPARYLVFGVIMAVLAFVLVGAGVAYDLLIGGLVLGGASLVAAIGCFVQVVRRRRSGQGWTER